MNKIIAYRTHICIFDYNLGDKPVIENVIDSIVNINKVSKTMLLIYNLKFLLISHLNSSGINLK